MAASNADSSADVKSPAKSLQPEAGGDQRAMPPYLLEVCPNVHSLVLAVSLPDLRHAEGAQGESKTPGAIIDAARDGQEFSSAEAVSSAPREPGDGARQPALDGNGILAGMLVTPFQAVIDGEEYKFPVPVEPRSMRQALRRLDTCGLKVASPGGAEARAEASGRADIELRFALQHVKGTARPSNAVRHRHFDAMPLLHVGFVSRATRLACAQCNTTLTRPPPIPSEENGAPHAQTEFAPVFERTRALPSSTWHELVECWACHEQAITMPSAGDAAAAEPGTCLVGASFLIVHREQLLIGTGDRDDGRDGTASAIVWRDHGAVGTHPGWSTAAPAVGTTYGPSQRARAAVAHCANCDAVLGIRARARVEFPSPESVYNEPTTPASASDSPCNAPAQYVNGSSPVDFGAHLFKTAVIAEEQQAMAASPPLAWNPAKIAQHALMAELIDLVTAHATPRALLVDVLAPRRPVAALWVLNWNCRVRTRVFASARALKVLYRDLREESAAASCGHVDGDHTDEAKNPTARAANAAAAALDRDDALALLPLPDSHLLVRLLVKANAALPPSQRAAELLGETWNVSYLMQ